MKNRFQTFTNNSDKKWSNTFRTQLFMEVILEKITMSFWNCPLISREEIGRVSVFDIQGLPPSAVDVESYIRNQNCSVRGPTGHSTCSRGSSGRCSSWHSSMSNSGTKPWSHDGLQRMTSISWPSSRSTLTNLLPQQPTRHYDVIPGMCQSEI